MSKDLEKVKKLNVRKVFYEIFEKYGNPDEVTYEQIATYLKEKYGIEDEVAIDYIMYEAEEKKLGLVGMRPDGTVIFERMPAEEVEFSLETAEYNKELYDFKKKTGQI